MRRVDSNDVTWSDVEVVLSGTRTEHRYLTQDGSTDSDGNTSRGNYRDAM